ncbi:hypothetical protein EST38_g8920 [Candolleomyces aberdarensis]|uniref:Uncharacterized protein n=1 Tax=Candolleomyces aberdarensis TaxID=2316362 RepID=A0A4Q2DB90_9AGAR|nr:hypothetical protein EST38_g8920 [Candolleomyces aberdarensis]
MRTSPDRRGATTPFHIGTADDQRQQLEELNEVALRLHDAALAAHQAEDQREVDFRSHEEDRNRLFVESEELRTREARERVEEIFKQIDERLAALPAPAPAPPAPEPPVEQPPAAESVVSTVSEEGSPEPEAEEPASPSSPSSPSSRVTTVHEDIPHRDGDVITIAATIREAAEQHAADVLETIRLEREEFARERAEAAAERERLEQEAAAERERLLEDRDERIRALEDELQKVKDELANEREARLTEEAAAREQDRAERMARDDAFEKQLSDITNLVQEQRDECERKKELMEVRWADKEDRRTGKYNQMLELMDMVQQLHNDTANDRARAAEERASCATKDDLRAVIDQVQQQNDEQRNILELFTETWRAISAQNQEETINAVKSTAQEQVPYNVQGYLNEFSKALATEVRMLLGEVGKLREDRRALQHEIATLFFMKSQWGPGGEFENDGQPAGAPPPDQGPPPDHPAEDPEPPRAHRPGWRTATAGKKGKKRKAAQQQQRQQYMQMEQAMHPPPETTFAQGQPLPRRPVPHGVSPRAQVQSWAAWHPDPNFEPSSIGSGIEPTLQVPAHRSPGLFGPSSEDESLYARLS